VTKLHVAVYGDSPQKRGERGAPARKKCYFTTIGLSSVKMAVDRHKHAAYHNKYWRQDF